MRFEDKQEQIKNEVFDPWFVEYGESFFDVVDNARILRASGVSKRSAEATLREFTGEGKNPCSIRPMTEDNRKITISAIAADEGTICITSEIQNSPFGASQMIFLNS